MINDTLLLVWKAALIEAIKKNPLQSSDDDDIIWYAHDIVADVDVDHNDDSQWGMYVRANIDALMEIYPQHEALWQEAWRSY